jgi:hypothetical protein
MALYDAKYVRDVIQVGINTRLDENDKEKRDYLAKELDDYRKATSPRTGFWSFFNYVFPRKQTLSDTDFVEYRKTSQEYKDLAHRIRKRLDRLFDIRSKADLAARAGQTSQIELNDEEAAIVGSWISSYNEINQLKRK